MFSELDTKMLFGFKRRWLSVEAFRILDYRDSPKCSASFRLDRSDFGSRGEVWIITIYVGDKSIHVMTKAFGKRRWRTVYDEKLGTFKTVRNK